MNRDDFERERRRKIGALEAELFEYRHKIEGIVAELVALDEQDYDDARAEEAFKRTKIRREEQT